MPPSNPADRQKLLLQQEIAKLSGESICCLSLLRRLRQGKYRVKLRRLVLHTILTDHLRLQPAASIPVVETEAEEGEEAEAAIGLLTFVLSDLYLLPPRLTYQTLNPDG